VFVKENETEPYRELAVNGIAARDPVGRERRGHDGAAAVGTDDDGV